MICPLCQEETELKFYPISDLRGNVTDYCSDCAIEILNERVATLLNYMFRGKPEPEKEIVN